MSKNEKTAEPLSQIDTQRLGCPSGDGVRLKRLSLFLAAPLFPPPARLSRSYFPPPRVPPLARVPGLGFLPSDSRSVTEPFSFRPAPWPKFDRVGAQFGVATFARSGLDSFSRFGCAWFGLLHARLRGRASTLTVVCHAATHVAFRSLAIFFLIKMALQLERRMPVKGGPCA